MPFYKTNTCEETAQVTLETAGPKTFRIKEPFWYQYPEGFSKTYRNGDVGVEISAHEGETTTDLASVPSFLQGVLASYGPHLLPALLHDQRCEEIRAKKRKGEKGLFLKRSTADYEFRKALADVGVGPVRRRVFWAGVALGKYFSYGPHRCLLLLLHLSIGIAALAGLALTAFGVHWLGLDTLWFGVLGFALVVSAFWGRDWSLPMIGILAGPLLISVILFTYAVMFVVFFWDGARQTPAAIRKARAWIKKLWEGAARKVRGTSGPATEAA
ncbi:DUF1353 domain-containing protein [Lentzea terrae]|uniref:DUF1353 domain-containing protein n=1 Tax=Lentzea terrae TaxID=2200761 RepID=UPI000DD3F506|nr:DUF1353 domain-containing protein [Lentzea terrae]